MWQKPIRSPRWGETPSNPDFPWRLPSIRKRARENREWADIEGFPLVVFGRLFIPMGFQGSTESRPTERRGCRHSKAL